MLSPEEELEKKLRVTAAEKDWPERQKLKAICLATLTELRGDNPTSEIKVKLMEQLKNGI